MKKKMLALAVACGAFVMPFFYGGFQANRASASEEWKMEFSQDCVGVAVLKQGSKNEQVKEMQRKLKAWGYYQGSVDGIFGAQTRKAVIAFQKKNGLKADGLVGNATFKALGMSVSNSSSATSTGGMNGFSSSEVYLLARTIYAEGRGEPYTGQVAIGAVVLNRVRSSQFPNTISGVV